jgi:hypothetical protein
MNMKDLSPSSLKDFLGDLSDVHLDSFSNDDVEAPFQTKPHDFLRFAEYDLNNKYEHHLINALSNLKRAIDCQLDSLLFGFGLYDQAKKKKLSFPKKVALLNSFGIISPRILKRINQKRNLLEHEYISPAEDDVEDALDVANLFIAYTDKFIQRALLECQPYNDKIKDVFEFCLDYKKRSLRLSTDIEKKGKTREIKKNVRAEDSEYFDYLKLFLSLYKIM